MLSGYYILHGFDICNKTCIRLPLCVASLYVLSNPLKSTHHTCVQVSRLFACSPVKLAIVLAKPKTKCNTKDNYSYVSYKNRAKSEDMKLAFSPGFKT